MKFPPPLNKNNRHHAEHVCYLGTTGSCKTTAIQTLGFIKKTDQVVIFDPYAEHAGQQVGQQRVKGFDTPDTFYQALWAARKTATPFAYALTDQPRTPAALERFANMVWSVCDGHHVKRLHCVIEELAKFTHQVSKLDGVAGELWTGGRGFGLVMHTTFQRSQEVPKTVLNESAYFYIGAVATPANAKWIDENLGVPKDEVLALSTVRDTGKHADYLLKSPGIGNWKKGQITPPRRAR